MKSRKLYISDLHLFHKNVTKAGRDFDNRPYQNLEEMHEDILKKWNDNVTRADHIYILGDFVWKFNDDNRDDVMKMLNAMNGNLHLILGNHDKANSPIFKQRFEEIVSYKRITDVVDGKMVQVIMSHYYMPFYEQHYRGAILLHGHTHNTAESAMERKMNKYLNENNYPIKAYNVGCMYPYMNYSPKTLQQISDGYKEFENDGVI